MRCAALTCRSYYSLLRGAVSVERLAERAKSYGYAAIAVADVNAMYGVVDFVKTAQKYEIHPIVGVDIRTGSESVKLLAENRTGYRNMCRITTARNTSADFDVVGELANNSEGLICLSACPLLLKKLREVIRADSLFAACSNICRVEWVLSKGLRAAACFDFNIVDDDDITTSKLLWRIRQLSGYGAQPAEKGGFNKLIEAREMEGIFGDCPEAVANNEEIFNRCCDFNLVDGQLHLPRIKLADGVTSERELSRLCHVGMARRYGKVTKEAVKRLEHELDVICGNGFSDYFLVVREIIEFAKRNNIPVDVRGSAAGSLVSYVLGFTRVCPIENNLYFERFMNPGRTDCPDIDVDLCRRRRDEVIKFCYENRGYDNVAMISTVSRYRVRSAIRDAARALTIEPSQINELVRRRRENPDRGVYKLAERLMGLPRHLGVHCGGIVITPEPVRDLSPLQIATKGVIVTQYDKDAAEAMGLVKIDLLGNRSLSTVDEAVRIISRDDLNIDAIDAADEKTAAMLSEGDSFGVFQCESPGMRQLLRGLKIRNKNDVAIALSLIRPGPAAGGMKNEYIQRHVYKKPFEYAHPRLKEVFGDTYGVLLFQEDVMRLAVEVAGYSVAEADRFRSEVSKKVPSKRFHRQYVDFVYGRANAAGIDRDTAEDIWTSILRFAAYSYCKAHATVYANIAWQTAYLKAHFPREFYTSLLNNHVGMYPLRIYVWDAIRHGVRILPPHVSKSEVEWSTEGRSIRAGLYVIKGLSYAAMDSIIDQRREGEFVDLSDLRRRVRLSRREIANLIHIGACDGLGNSRPAMLMQLNYEPPAAGQFTMFELMPNPTKEQFADYDRLARLKAEVDVSGIPFCMHPELLVRKKHVLARSLGRYINREVVVAGFIATARSARTSDGRTMGFVTLEDSTGLAEVSFFPDEIEKYRQIVSQSGPIWVRGKVTEHLSSLNIECHGWGTAA